MKNQQKPKLIEGLFSKDLESSEIKNEINYRKKIEEQINRNELIYKSSKHVYDFRRFQTISSFGDGIFSGKITISEANEKKSNLLNVISNFDDRVRPR